MSDFEVPTITFADFDLRKQVLKAVTDVGYETPSPIQAQTIPLMLEGRDVVGQAQTGTGKTAAFALPILSTIDLQQKSPQALVLVPTRELAIQVAEAFQRYATHLKDLHVLPVYGGQSYEVQFRQLHRGVHIIVGTPGRVMDHMRRETLDLSELRVLVLDEADEMLRMGFIDDVKWVLEQTPPERQIALFSATMPAPIRRIAQQHLRDAAEVTIQVKTSTAETIHQRYWPVSYTHKLDALTRILEFEPFDGMLIFVRTKADTVELAERLEARGHACAALNGDIAQSQRERIVNHLKNGKIDIVVATDVAARGLDVERISHVVNMDMPYDTESYVHRVGRTGRAGRKGEAILFVTPRERGMLSAIEKATRQKIELLRMPSTDDINDRRVAEFKRRIKETLEAEDLGTFPKIIEDFIQEHTVSPVEVAAALARIIQGAEPFLLPRNERPALQPAYEPREAVRNEKERGPGRKPGRETHVERELFRLEVGASHGATPSHIVGAIANEAGLPGKLIGQIDIHEEFSIVALPPMPREIFQHLQNVRVAGHKLQISRVQEGEAPPPRQKTQPARPGNKKAGGKKTFKAGKNTAKKARKKSAN